MKKAFLVSLFIGFMSIGSSASAAPFSISMVADNDFAIFSGTGTSINNLLYQNDVDWYTQIPSISTLEFNLAAGDDTFYVLGMGGGGVEENISGVVNGVNMTDALLPVSMSSDLSSYLTGYNSAEVAAGTYDALLADVQAAFEDVTWSDAHLYEDSSETVIVAGGFGSGFSYDTNTAHLFSFIASDVKVEAVPEPSVIALLALGLVGLSVSSRRRKMLA